MADTTFVAQSTRIQADWLNAINNFFYTLFQGATTPVEACEALGAIRVEGTPTDGQIPVWNDGASVWEPADQSGGGGVANPLQIIGDSDSLATMPQIWLRDGAQDGVAIVVNPSTRTLTIHRLTSSGSVDIAPSFTFATNTAVATAGDGETFVSPDWIVDPA